MIGPSARSGVSAGAVCGFDGHDLRARRRRRAWRAGASGNVAIPALPDVQQRQVLGLVDAIVGVVGAVGLRAVGVRTGARGPCPTRRARGPCGSRDVGRVLGGRAGARRCGSAASWPCVGGQADDDDLIDPRRGDEQAPAVGGDRPARRARCRGPPCGRRRSWRVDLELVGVDDRDLVGVGDGDVRAVAAGSTAIASGCERCGPTVMSLTLVAAARSITDTVPGSRWRPGRSCRRGGSPRRRGSCRSRRSARRPVADVDDRRGVGEVERHEQRRAVGRDGQAVGPARLVVDGGKFCTACGARGRRDGDDRRPLRRAGLAVVGEDVDDVALLAGHVVGHLLGVVLGLRDARDVDDRVLGIHGDPARGAGQDERLDDLAAAHVDDPHVVLAAAGRDRPVPAPVGGHGAAGRELPDGSALAQRVQLPAVVEQWRAGPMRPVANVTAIPAGRRPAAVSSRAMTRRRLMGRGSP